MQADIKPGEASEAAGNLWCSSLLVVRFDDVLGQEIVGCCGGELSSETLLQVKMMSMPENLQAGKVHSLVKFCFKPDRYTFSFVVFRQHRDESSRRGYVSQSVVLISSLSCIGLFYSVLEHLSDMLVDGPEIEIEQTLRVSFSHFRSWPRPRSGDKLRLPFFGFLLSYTCPSLPTYHLAGSTGLDGGLGLFADGSIFDLVEKFGLLPHLWTLWELVLCGRDILVFSPSAEVCSTVVTTLVILAAPLAHAGDFRPYQGNTDIATLTATASSSKTARIVGVTNPFLLRAFGSYSAALFVPVPSSTTTVEQGDGPVNPAPEKSWSLASSLASSFVFWGASTTTPSSSSPSPSPSSSPPARNLRVRAKVIPADFSLEAEYDRWASRSKSATQGLLCLRAASRLSPDPNITRRLASISETVKDASHVRVVSNMLLREHFCSLTLALLRPLETVMTASSSIIDLGDATAVREALLALGPLRSTATAASKGGTASLSMPPCLCVPGCHEIISDFAASPHFLAFWSWRQKGTSRR